MKKFLLFLLATLMLVGGTLSLSACQDYSKYDNCPLDVSAEMLSSESISISLTVYNISGKDIESVDLLIVFNKAGETGKFVSYKTTFQNLLQNGGNAKMITPPSNIDNVGTVYVTYAKYTDGTSWGFKNPSEKNVIKSAPGFRISS